MAPLSLNRLRAARLAAALLIGALLPTGIAHADVRTGVAAWEAGNYAAAIAQWRPLAENGDPDAQFNLAQAYKLGRGVPQSFDDAVEWFRRAADQGHLQAEDNLGLVLYEMGRRAEALPWLERAVSRGEPRAQYVLAAELFNGQIVQRDWVRAYALMKRSSDSGLQRASAALVQMDQHIPMEDRRRGLALAETLERAEGQARVAALTGATPPPAPAATPAPAAAVDPRRAVPAPVRTTDVPPSAAGTTYRAPPLPGQVEPAPAAAPAATAAPGATPAPATAGGWMVQLGAFSTEARARSLWSSLSGRMAGATPRYVAAGAVTRLQAGPYASRAAAESACAAIRPQGCFAVAR